VGRKKLKRKREPKRRIRWPRWTGISGSTLRDWLPIVGALLIPLLIFYGTAQITQEQANSEAKRAEAERELAEQRAQDETLQAYFDQMSGLLLEKDLRTSKEDSEVRTLARARTLTVLGRLDPSRKTAIMQFLVEADLVQRVDGRDPIISLRGANLSDVFLNAANLSGANLVFAELGGADLSYANLQNANLQNAHLQNANLQGADLSSADLRGANLSSANLQNANLQNANLIGALGQDAILSGATMPNGQKYEDWLKDREGQGELQKGLAYPPEFGGGDQKQL
jgi:uncharacterized protein YjbI with pentapeptide repeats